MTILREILTGTEKAVLAYHNASAMSVAIDKDVNQLTADELAVLAPIIVPNKELKSMLTNIAQENLLSRVQG